MKFVSNVKIVGVKFIDNIKIEDSGYFVSLKSAADINIESPNIDGPGMFNGNLPFNVSILCPMDLNRYDRNVFFKVNITYKHRGFLYSFEQWPAIAELQLFNLFQKIGNTDSNDDISDVSILLSRHEPDKKIEKLINELVLLSRGIPIGSPKSLFMRMLYLSMVTITTLGYGDIVPLTDTARLLVGFEAVLGIVILGLIIAIFSEPNQN